MSGTQTPPPPYRSPSHEPSNSYHDQGRRSRATTVVANLPTETAPLKGATTINLKLHFRRHILWPALVCALAPFALLATWLFASQAVPSERQDLHTAWEKLEHHRAVVKDEVEAFKKQEYEIQRRIRDLEAKEKAQDESRKMLSIFWDVSPPGAEKDCQAYGVRYYYSRLNGVPREFDGVRACRKKAHPELGFPTWCEKNEWGVFGHWRITDDSSCKISWGINSLTNTGCTAAGSGKRRYEQHMERLLHHSEDDWFTICTTAPTDFHGLHFDKPDYCSDRGNGEIFGIWEVDDKECLD